MPDYSLESSRSLLRPQVAHAQQREWIGTIVIVPPRVGWHILAAGFVLIVALVSIVAFGTYSRREQALGVLMLNKALVNLYSPSRGIVSEVLVREGQVVQSGQALAVVKSNAFSRLGDTRQAIVSELEIRRAKLLQDRAGLGLKFDLERQQLSRNVESFTQQEKRIKAQAGIEQKRESAAQALYREWSSPSGTRVVSKVQLSQQLDLVLQHRAQYEDLSRQALELARQANDASASLAELPSDLQAKQNDLDRQLADVAQQLYESDLAREAILRAPRSGRIENVLVHAGQVVDQDQTLLGISPVGAELQANLLVPDEDIGFLSVGDSVLVEYAPYPSRRFGRSKGTVISVGNVPLSAEEASHFFGKTISDPRYLVRVKIAEQALVLYGKRYSLRPGTEVTADILLGKQRILSRLLEPARNIGQ